MNQVLCPVCKSVDIPGNKNKWIACDFCDKWHHAACVGLKKLSKEDINTVNWHCNACKKSVKKMYVENPVLQVKIVECEKRLADQMERNADLSASIATDDKIDSGFAKLDTRMDVIENSIVEKKGQSVGYSGALKKNLLVIKSSIEDEKIVERKQQVASALKGTKYIDTSFPKSGNIVVNFSNENDRQVAATQLQTAVPDSTVKVVNKIMPKIMICNVLEDDQPAREDVVQSLIENNECLSAIDRIEEKIKFIFDKPANGNTKHYVLRCDPSVRNAIYRSGDKLRFVWTRYDVRDRYHVRYCLHCQGYNHTFKECKIKANNKTPTCANCAENHTSRDCPTKDNRATFKCITCVKSGKDNVNHRAHSSECPVFNHKLSEVKSITDHGC